MDPVAGWGGEKHEIDIATFGGHLFYYLFLQGRVGRGGGGMAPWFPYPLLLSLAFHGKVYRIIR